MTPKLLTSVDGCEVWLGDCLVEGTAEQVLQGSPDDEFIQEAADVANFAMMIADNASKKGGAK